MFNCIRNEILKYRHSKKFYIFLFALCILIAGRFVYMYNDISDKTPSKQIEQNLKIMIDLKTNLKDESISKAEKKILKMKLSELTSQNKILKNEIKNKNNAWKNIINQNIKQLKNAKKGLIPKLDNNEIEQYNSQIKYNEYLLKNNIKPNKPYKIYAFSNIIDILNFISKMILPILIAFLCSNIISGEYSASTIKMLLTKPISRKKVLLSKFLSNVFIVTISVFVCEILMFLIMGFVFGFGNYNYPFSVGTRYTKVFNSTLKVNEMVSIIGSSYIIPIWKVILTNLLMQFVFIVSAVSFNIFISTIFIKDSISLSISLIVFCILSIITFLRPFKIFSCMYGGLLTSYVCGSDILNGSLNLCLNNQFLSIDLGITVMVIWTLICYLISSIVFSKRDIL